MGKSGPHAARAIWSTRTAQARPGRGYAIYLAAMVVVVAVFPVARAIWLALASPGALLVLSSPAAPSVTAAIVASVWGVAMLLGRDRGPAVLLLVVQRI